MKLFSLLNTLVIASFLVFSPDVSADHEKATKILRKINTIFYKQVTKSLKLESPQKDRVIKLLKKYDYKKEEKFDQLLKVKHKLHQKKHQRPPESQFVIADLIKEIKKMRLEINQIEKEKISSLQSLISQQQLATFLIIADDRDEKIANALNSASHK